MHSQNRFNHTENSTATSITAVKLW